MKRRMPRAIPGPSQALRSTSCFLSISQVPSRSLPTSIGLTAEPAGTKHGLSLGIPRVECIHSVLPLPAVEAHSQPPHPPNLPLVTLALPSSYPPPSPSTPSTKVVLSISQSPEEPSTLNPGPFLPVLKASSLQGVKCFLQCYPDSQPFFWAIKSPSYVQVLHWSHQKSYKPTETRRSGPLHSFLGSLM